VRGLDRTDELDRFLAGIERRALRFAELATRDRDEALDLVQDAMTALVRQYAARPPAEWPPLFHRILHNRIRDWARRRSLRDRFRAWLGRRETGDESTSDPIEELPDAAQAGPAALAERAADGARIEAALLALPLRQRQAFLLRAWEGLDVAETARAMRCSQGSVKTHYSRAIQSLRVRLGDEPT
jgi:RNA polymerase sigma-70 factor, ECF subfamily